jgi:twinkle protein
VGHEPCPECGSKDNLARYDDGHAYCFGGNCNYREHSIHSVNAAALYKPKKKNTTLIQRGEFKDLTKRKISEKTCRFFSYSVGKYNNQDCHIAEFKENGTVVGQKIRLKNHSFKTLGDCSSLWGKHLWSTGRKIVITEGEIDAQSVAEIQNCKWPVVSLPNGAASAKKAVQKDYEWLVNNFDEIILMFDMDKAGQTASLQVSELFKPGKCKIAKLPEKDANECLKKGLGDQVVSAVWNARVVRPDGIIAGEDTWDLVNTPMTPSDHEYPWQGLNNKTLGARKGELVTFCAGTGAGKSTVVKEIASYFLSKGETIGYMALEESVRQAAIDFMSIEANQMLHLEKDLDQKFKRETWEKVFSSGRLFLYDHWGSVDGDVLTNTIRYLVRSCGVNWIVLDHISIVVSGVDGGDERRLIDNLMTKLRSLAEELNVGMFIVSHLKRPMQGKGHEDGKQISIGDLRGSGAIAQLSDFVIGLERNQQEGNETTVRVLKARYKGSSTGVATSLFYSPDTGRLSEFNESNQEGCRKDTEPPF